MSPLLPRLVSQIQENGPMTVGQFMQIALTDPSDGYYTNQNPFGRSGDFITAPEISQLFGEMIGIWSIDVWQKMGAPAKFQLIEAGPGRGTLMADVLRTIQKLAPPMLEAATVSLIEISPALKEKQRQALSTFDVTINWHDTLSDVADQPIILLANEFLDALPIRQFLFQENRWHERAIGLSSDGSLEWGLIPATITVPSRLSPNAGDIFEICTPAQTFCASVCETIKNQGGAALFIDYGHLESGFGDTFQAVKDHQYVNVLEAVGQADLTAHIDFDPLAKIGENADLTVKTTTQGAFLLEMGILQRAGQLGANLDIEQQKIIQNDVERLAAPDKMGNLFKAMTFAARGMDLHGFN
ncbi:MAG: SAM-dependent methyltransferase [Hyphomicrobiales bacterium]